MKEAEPDVYEHLISVGVTKDAAGVIGADLYDLKGGLAKIEAAFLSMKGSTSEPALLQAQQEIELHLLDHLRSLNTEIKRLRKTAWRTTPRRS